MAPVRLIAIDIDGTLLDRNFQITVENLNALRRAHELGIEVALVTGRRHDFALPVAKALGFEVALISSNGAVSRRSSGELFHRDLMPVETARQLIGHMTDFRNYFVVTFDREHKCLACETAEELNLSIQRWIEKNAEHILFIRPVEDSLTEDPIQTMFCGTVEKMRAAEEHLLANDALTQNITVLKTQYDERDLCIIDVLNAGCSKGHALARWAEHRGYTRAEVMAIGDNFNDVEMLEYAGVPFIMGNATDELKRRDWSVTLPNDQSGVAHAVNLVLAS